MSVKGALFKACCILSFLQLLTPLVESILQKDMEFFAQYAVQQRITAD